MREGDGAAAAAQRVVGPVAAHHYRVGAGAASNRVITTAAFEKVVACPTTEAVVAATAAEGIGASAAEHGVAAIKVGGRHIDRTAGIQATGVNGDAGAEGGTRGVGDSKITLDAVLVGIGGAVHHVAKRDGGIAIGIECQHINVLDALEVGEVVVACSIEADGIDLRIWNNTWGYNLAIAINDF